MSRCSRCHTVLICLCLSLNNLETCGRAMSLVCLCPSVRATACLYVHTQSWSHRLVCLCVCMQFCLRLEEPLQGNLVCPCLSVRVGLSLLVQQNRCQRLAHPCSSVCLLSVFHARVLPIRRLCKILHLYVFLFCHQLFLWCELFII